MSTITQPAPPVLRYAVAQIEGVDFRDASANHDGSWTISGYAAVFNQETTLYDGAYAQVNESIAPDAFRSVLASPHLVHLNVGHDMNRAVASTDVPQGQIGSLVLTTDDHGLRFLARIDRNDPDAQALAVKMQRGVAKQASFAFTIGSQEEMPSRTLADGRESISTRITQVRSLFDVCVTPQGAYAQTEATLRSIGASMGQPARAGGLQGEPDEGRLSDHEAREAEVVATESRLALARLRAKARMANLPLKDQP